MTLLEVLQSTTGYFKQRNVESPRLNAEYLLAHVLKVERIDLYLEFERTLTEEELAPLRELVRRRGQGEPLQHLLGTVEFCGHTFICDKRALIPRPETEELVELVQSEIQAASGGAKSKMLDVGTGSGVIALSLAAKFPKAEVHGIDVSEEALALARENAERLGLTSRVTFFGSDLLTNVSHEYDLIVANLPYVAIAERDSLLPEVLRDPTVALFAGECGDELIRDLIAAAPAHLRPGGRLALEIGIDQAEGLTALIENANFYDISARRDFSGVIRFLFGSYG
ncbi:MAG: peptide chain release factor N(5)-glutamine methyltransferase [Chthoniobacterales bacterium]